MYKKILVPLDGSELAEKVLPYAIQFTARFQAETVLLMYLRLGSLNHQVSAKLTSNTRRKRSRAQLQEIAQKSKFSAGKGSMLIKSEK